MTVSTKHAMAGVMSLALMLGTAAPAFANTADQAYQNALARQEVRQENRGIRRDARFERVANRVEMRMKNHEQRLTDLINRVETRANKMRANGKDVSAALGHLTTARTLVTEAVALKTTAVSKMRAIQAEKWSDQAPEVQEAKTAILTAEGAFKKVMTEIIAALKSLAEVAGTKTTN